MDRSTFSQRTIVPVEGSSSIANIRSKSVLSRTDHEFSFTTVSKSQVKAAISPCCFETTVNRRHCENEAVFSPNPKRPKSPMARSSLGSVLPRRMAWRRSERFSPLPSSMMATLKESSIGNANTEIRLAHAVMELSMISARALLKEYPISRRLSTNIPGSGASSISSVICCSPFLAP